MKLIGSKTEDDLRERLQASHRLLFSDPRKSRLLSALRSVCPEMRTAYVLGWTLEQGEDLYTVLIDEDAVVSVELDRVNPDASPIVGELVSVRRYVVGLRGTDRIKLAVALDLVRRERLEGGP